MNTPHKLYVDASLYKESVCMHKINNILMHGWQDSIKGFKMEYGTAFHKFCAAFRSGVQQEAAIALAINHYSKPETQAQIGEDFRHSGHLFNTCFQYALKYPVLKDELHLLHDSNKNPLTEIRFKFPFMTREIRGILYEVILSGTIDSLNTHDKHNAPVICDIKSTSSWDYRDYLAGYRLSPQLKFYKYIVEKVATLYPDTFGAFAQNVGCIVDGVFLKKDGVFFQRSEIFTYTAREMNEFESNLRSFCERLLDCIANNYFPKNEVACDMYPFGLDDKKGCKFKLACGSSCGITDDEQASEIEVAYLERNFTKKPYNPMEFGA